MSEHASPTPETETAISLVRDDLLFRVQRAMGLIPAQGLGLVRRVLFYAGLTWVPLAVWALATRRALPGQGAEPLLTHYGIHAQLLLALPALILGEGLVHQVTTRLIPQFVVSGVVPTGEVGRFREVIRGIVKLRRAALPWLIILVGVMAWLVMPPGAISRHELGWAESTSTPGLGFGGWWYLYVARPVFQLFLLGWAWRVVLMLLLLRRIARLDLQLAPLHPDRVGGLAFVQEFPRALAPFAFACSALLSARWAHEVVYHGAHATSFKAMGAVFVVGMLAVCIAPLAMFIPRLGKVRRMALLEYGTLVGEHSRLVHERWIGRREGIDSKLLNAPELGPAADIASLYDGVRRMKSMPIGKETIMGIAIPVLLPLLAFSATEIPLRELLGKIVKGLL